MEQPKKRKTLLVWLLLFVACIAAFTLLNSDRALRFREFYEFHMDVGAGRVEEVRVLGNRITVTLRGTGEKYYTLGALGEETIVSLSEQGVPVRQGAEPTFPQWLLMVMGIVLVGIGVLWYLARRARGIPTDVFSFTKSRARIIPDAGKVTFADVGGCEEAKRLLGDVIDFLRDPQRWAQAGVRVPRGVLLEGPPGCGKTLLARGVAGETNARFYLACASEFVEVFVGVGAARVRDTFEVARKNAPAVIFVDELDAVGRRRGSGIGSSHDEREQTLNQLLVCLEGFEGREPVVVIAATNRPDILDPALVRPGRFDRRIRIPPLSVEGRLQALRIHTRNKCLAAEVSLQRVAERTEGFNGAQLENLANEAAVAAIRRVPATDGQRPEVRMEDFLEALRPTQARSRLFDQLDAVLLESTTQLAEPTGKAFVRAVLEGGSTVEGELVWADAHFLKIRGAERDAIVPKAQIQRIEALPGTETADPLDVVPDPWAGRQSGTV